MKLKYKRITKKTFKQPVVSLLKTFKKEGFEMYAVGGCVRDLLMNEEPHDIDLTTNAKPEEIMEILKKAKIDYHTLGIKFGTIVAHVSEEDIEITTYRSESNNDGRHCDVTFVSSIEQDLARRDFTINAMAYDYLTDKIIDPFGGIEDLNNSILRSVGDSKERFQEDTLRVLRAIRFAIKYNFRMELELSNNVNYFIENNLIDNLSKERISKELMTILSINDLTKENLNLLKPLLFHLFPVLSQQENYNQNNKYHCFDLWTHTCKATLLISQIANNTFVNIDIAKCRLATLLHDIGKPFCESKDEDGVSHYFNHSVVGYNMVNSILKDMKFSKKDIEFITTLIKYHDADFVGESEKSIKKLIKKVGEDKIESLFAVMLADKKTHNMEYATPHYLNLIKALNTYKTLKENSELTVESDNLAVNGHDIMKKFNLGPSVLVGQLIKTASNAVDDGIVDNKKTDILDYISSIFVKTN